MGLLLLWVIHRPCSSTRSPGNPLFMPTHLAPDLMNRHSFGVLLLPPAILLLMLQTHRIIASLCSQGCRHCMFSARCCPIPILATLHCCQYLRRFHLNKQKMTHPLLLPEPLSDDACATAIHLLSQASEGIHLQHPPQRAGKGTSGI